MNEEERTREQLYWLAMLPGLAHKTGGGRYDFRRDGSRLSWTNEDGFHIPYTKETVDVLEWLKAHGLLEDEYNEERAHELFGEEADELTRSVFTSKVAIAEGWKTVECTPIGSDGAKLIQSKTVDGVEVRFSSEVSLNFRVSPIALFTENHTEDFPIGIIEPFEVKRFFEVRLRKASKNIALKELALMNSNEEESNTSDEEDVVNSPSHYRAGGIETIDCIEACVVGYEGIEAVCVGNAIKYLARAPHKGSALEDLQKARWYIDKLLEVRERSEDEP